MRVLHLGSGSIRLKFVCFAGLVLPSEHTAWNLIQEILQQARVATLATVLHSTLKLLDFGLCSLVREFALATIRSMLPTKLYIPTITE